MKRTQASLARRWEAATLRVPVGTHELRRHLVDDAAQLLAGLAAVRERGDQVLPALQTTANTTTATVFDAKFVKEGRGAAGTAQQRGSLRAPKPLFCLVLHSHFSVRG
jgi:hypothetical protein